MIEVADYVEVELFGEINIKAIYRKTLTNRFKVKMLCWFFPFKLIKWEREEKW